MSDAVARSLAREDTHFWVSLNTCRLIPNARLVHLGIHNFQQIKGVVNPSCSKALDLSGFSIVLAGAFFRCSRSSDLAASSNGTRACGLGLSFGGFLRSCLWCGLLCMYRSLFLGE